MNRSETCPDCGTGLGEPHKNECNIERGDWPEGSKIASNEFEADGFIIVESSSPSTPKPQPLPVPPPSRPERHYSDEFQSANSRMDWETHAIWPIYVNGKPTGEWRGFVRSDRFDVLGKNAHWDKTFPDFDTAKQWGRQVSEALKKAKK